MACPFLTEVTMVFCKACPQRKPIPSDRISTATACTNEHYQTCPIFREALAHMQEGAREHELNHAADATKGRPS